jgi:hypothetical protein
VQYPQVALVFEKVLLVSCLPLAASMQTWGVVAAVGASHAAYYLAIILCVLYYLFGLPLPSSFHKKANERAIGVRPAMLLHSLALIRVAFTMGPLCAFAARSAQQCTATHGKWTLPRGPPCLFPGSGPFQAGPSHWIAFVRPVDLCGFWACESSLHTRSLLPPRALPTLCVGSLACGATSAPHSPRDRERGEG